MNTWTVKAHQLRQAQAAILTEILNDLDDTDPKLVAYKNRHLNPRSAAGDKHRMRMIPIQAKGVGGTIPRTDPLTETIRKERWQSVHTSR